MIKKGNVKQKSLIMFFAIIFGLVAITLALLSNKLSDVKAESLNNYDIYTNSDNLIYDTDKTIFDYYLGDNPLYATKAKLVTK